MAKKALCLACGQKFDATETKCPSDGTRLTPIGGVENLVGEILDRRYKILDLVGEGTSGLVYRAQQLTVDRIVAIKVLHLHLASSEEDIKRFQREAQATHKLRHANLLTIIDFGITGDGQPYMVTEFLEGTNLKWLVEASGPLAPERVLPLMIQVCQGLSVAHAAQVLHRDLKPSNIVLVGDGDDRELLKIIDFGLAKFLDDNMHLTQTGQVQGTPAYMSPEQCLGRELDQRSDVYSLACVIYYVLTGYQPFLGRDPGECFSKQLNENPPPFKQVAPTAIIGAAIEQVVMKALGKEPEKRHQNIDELAQDLGRALRVREQIASNPVSSSPPLVPAVGQPTSKSEPQILQSGLDKDPQSDSLQSRKQQHVMHDVEKGSNRLVARDQYQRVDDRKPEYFAQVRKRQTEELSQRILRSVKSSFLGDQTMAWLQDVKEDIQAISEESGEANQLLCQLSMAALMDKLFDDFQRYAYQFNQTEETRDYVVTCVRPERRKGEGPDSLCVGQLQNSVWAMIVIGDVRSLRFSFLPANLLYQHDAATNPLSAFLELSVRVLDQGPGWVLGGVPIYLHQLPLMSKKIFARLVRVSRGEVTEVEPLSFDPDSVKGELDRHWQTQADTRQDPADTITYALISMLEAIDGELVELQQKGVEALKESGIDAVTPIVNKTRHYQSIREKTAALAQEWARVLSS
ncbi:MAG: serine/threonine protein kinase [Candidatus Obscuribacterales bacterium]|nr:serine/threonine protein kinase [Candidatus Obscuribacterales bacterium]